VILDCDRLWTRLVSAVYRLRRKPRVTNDPPPVGRTTGPTPMPAEPARRAER
jgi:hypothetical protein